MNIEVNNLAALMQERSLSPYQIELAIDEWYTLVEYVEGLEKKLSNNHDNRSKTKEKQTK